MAATITAITDTHEVGLKYNPELIISTGKSRYETKWKNKKILWSALLSKLKASVETPETHAEFMQLTKDEQDKIKDIGGFVGGHLKDGRRKTGYVVARQILTLDIDFAPEDLVDQLKNAIDEDLICAMAIYSTHKHTDKKPRLRLIIPLDREVTPEEYEAIARKIAEKVGIDYFDDSTYQATRLMYWPSHPTDVVPFFWHQDAPVLKADNVLAEYPDWTDTSYWPESSRMSGIRQKAADKQGDPTGKKGIVGAFCRTYDVREAIAKFLPGVYTETAHADRYTYAAGSTAGGLVIYEGGKFAYSNHSTDPASGQLCNAFDLVRLHKYGDLDDGHEKATGKKRPSYQAMAEMAAEDPETKITLVNERRDSAAEDFADDVEGPAEDWRLKLQLNEDGSIKPTVTNAELILEHDPALKCIKYNELSRAVEVVGSLPWGRPDKYWRNADDAQLYCWVARRYGTQFPQNKFTAAMDAVVDRRRFNPLIDYLNDLPEWDGVERIETILIDYLGASDNQYVREVTKRTLIGAVRRAYEPGCKFDYVLVLDGKPGIGKSTLLSTLGGEFFSDSLSLTDTRDKTAAEKLQGIWIMEIGEMQGTRKADIEAMKSFISCQVDKYRPAYGKTVEHRPRTAILCGTTNSMTGFLRDTTGNRRFWPVMVPGGGVKSVWDITPQERDQIWAEALSLYACGEQPYLDPEMEKQAQAEQFNALEYDERTGDLIEYLDTLLPEDWYDRTPEARIDFFQNRDSLSAEEECTLKRTKVCSMEIWRECLGRSKRDWSRSDSYDIASLMARVPGWERTVMQRMPGYGMQRPFERV
jgi:predicted P-loop ATPase